MACIDIVAGLRSSSSESTLLEMQMWGSILYVAGVGVGDAIVLLSGAK